MFLNRSRIPYIEGGRGSFWARASRKRGASAVPPYRLGSSNPMPDLRAKLLSLYDLFPFHAHPFWVAVTKRELSYEEVIRGEAQHWLRTRAGQRLRRDALDMAERISPRIFEMLLETYLEECTEDASEPTHLDLIERLVLQAEWTTEQARGDRCDPRERSSDRALSGYRFSRRRLSHFGRRCGRIFLLSALATDLLLVHRWLRDECEPS